MEDLITFLLAILANIIAGLVVSYLTDRHSKKNLMIPF